MPPVHSMSLPINLRRWMIERFAQQRESENEEIEASKRKTKRK